MRERDSRMLDTLYTTIDRYTAGVRAKRLVEPSDPVLAWLIFAGLNLLTFLLLWFYGLLQKALDADPTHITLFITLIYFATSLHCLWRCVAVSRETVAQKHLFASLAESEHALHRIVTRNASNGVEDGGLVSAHVRDLMTKSMRLPKEQKLDQSLLLRVLTQRLNGSTPFGAFASDLVMKLGLFGTIVGFIMMLAPIAGLNGDDQAAIKSSMTLMSAGMAVAMYTTLAGLVGSILIRIEYQFVEWATSRLFASTVALTEVHVIPLSSAPGRDAMIEEFNFQSREAPFDPLSAILFKVLQVTAFLFFIAFLALSQQKDTGKIDTKAEFFVSMTWPDNHPDDFDSGAEPIAAVWGRDLPMSGGARRAQHSERRAARLRAGLLGSAGRQGGDGAGGDQEGQSPGRHAADLHADIRGVGLGGGERQERLAGRHAGRRSVRWRRVRSGSPRRPV